MKKRVKIAIRDYKNNTYKKVPWKGHIVAGTDGLMAVTRVARGYDKLYEGVEYLPTHLPTGYAAYLLSTTNFRQAIKNAKRLYKLLLKHKMPLKDPEMFKHFTPELKAEAVRRWA